MTERLAMHGFHTTMESHDIRYLRGPLRLNPSDFPGSGQEAAVLVNCYVLPYEIWICGNVP